MMMMMIMMIKTLKLDWATVLLSVDAQWFFFFAYFDDAVPTQGVTSALIYCWHLVFLLFVTVTNTHSKHLSLRFAEPLRRETTTRSFLMPVRLFVRIEGLGSHSTNFREILCWGIFTKIRRTNAGLLIWDTAQVTLYEDLSKKR